MLTRRHSDFGVAFRSTRGQFERSRIDVHGTKLFCGHVVFRLASASGTSVSADVREAGLNSSGLSSMWTCALLARRHENPNSRTCASGGLSSTAT